MPVTHKFVSAKEDDGDTSLVRASSWNEDHVLSGVPDITDIGDVVRLPVLIEEQILSSPGTEVSFTSLDGQNNSELLLLFNILASATCSLKLEFNTDATSGNYFTYSQFQEGDGNNHHLTSWDSTQTFARVYNVSPYYTYGELFVNNFLTDYVQTRSNWNMVRGGWGETSTDWYKSGGGWLNKIRLFGPDGAVTMTGRFRLYKFVDLEV